MPCLTVTQRESFIETLSQRTYSLDRLESLRSQTSGGRYTPHPPGTYLYRWNLLTLVSKSPGDFQELNRKTLEHRYVHSGQVTDCTCFEVTWAQ